MTEPVGEAGAGVKDYSAEYLAASRSALISSKQDYKTPGASGGSRQDCC
jgi:hypothetical protein